MTLTGLSDENIIKYLTTVIMKCKFPSLTPMLLLYLLDYYTHCENFSEAGAGQQGHKFILLGFLVIFFILLPEPAT